MKIAIKVKANAKTNSIEKTGENSYTLRVNAPAKEGRANVAVIGLLSEHFGVPKSRISILKGQTNKNKVISIQQHPACQRAII